MYYYLTILTKHYDLPGWLYNTDALDEKLSSPIAMTQEKLPVSIKCGNVYSGRVNMEIPVEYSVKFVEPLMLWSIPLKLMNAFWLRLVFLEDTYWQFLTIVWFNFRWTDGTDRNLTALPWDRNKLINIKMSWYRYDISLMNLNL